MNSKNRNIVLVVVLVVIVGAIWYLQSNKPVYNAADVKDIVVDDATTTPENGVMVDEHDSTTMPTSTPVVAPVKPAADRTAIRAEKAKGYPRAKEFVNPDGFINTPAFKLSSIVGKKVVLIDFWTYSCINCQRTTPYLNAWYQKYKNLGLEIVGVHTPEFDFEKIYSNVSKGTADLGIKYPVVMDSAMGTWNAYQNQYWPREYLVDIDGFIVHDKIGEGAYDESERAIQKALQERSDALGLNLKIPTSIVNPADVISMDTSKIQSPETYFGSNRNEYLSNGQRQVAGTQTLTIPTQTSVNALYLGGTWDFKPEYAETKGPAKIKFIYNAKNVYFVASSKNGSQLKVYQDGKLVNTVSVKDNTLYTLIKGPEYGAHTLEIDVDGAGLDAFTFTFG